ncbi:DUF3473 domain-containing protein [Metabacillus flavus]|uniref:DUF3473 domain-containing protein n=1 Tax=Metabacillus flavus TaxID=2823519 RepID=UPI003D6495DE
MKRLLATRNKPFVFYLHPYDVDHEQPITFSFNINKLIQQYYGRKTAYNRLEKLMKVGEFTTIKEFLSIEGEQIYGTSL